MTDDIRESNRLVRVSGFLYYIVIDYLSTACWFLLAIGIDKYLACI